jgi:hypothetical protein
MQFSEAAVLEPGWGILRARIDDSQRRRVRLENYKLCPDLKTNVCMRNLASITSAARGSNLGSAKRYETSPSYLESMIVLFTNLCSSTAEIQG